MKETNYSKTSYDKESEGNLANVTDYIFGGSRLWSEIIKEVEKDVVRDKQNAIDSDPNFVANQGINNIFKLINDNILEGDDSKFSQTDITLLKILLTTQYDSLKKDVANVRVLRVGNTGPEMAVAMAKSAARFVGGCVAFTAGMVGNAIETAGKLVHITPAAYLINRLPIITKKEKKEVPAILREGNKEITVRTNFIELIGQGIQEGANWLQLKSNAPLFAKAIARLDKKTIKKIDVIKKEGLTSIKVEGSDEALVDATLKTLTVLPNIRKGNTERM